MVDFFIYNSWRWCSIVMRFVRRWLFSGSVDSRKISKNKQKREADEKKMVKYRFTYIRFNYIYRFYRFKRMQNFVSFLFLSSYCMSKDLLIRFFFCSAVINILVVVDKSCVIHKYKTAYIFHWILKSFYVWLHICEVGKKGDSFSYSVVVVRYNRMCE